MFQETDRTAKLCPPDTELLAVELRPYYLPWEFWATIVVTVYTPPSAVVIHTIVDQQTHHSIHSWL